jgi:hypothetical protein
VEFFELHFKGFFNYWLLYCFTVNFSALSYHLLMHHNLNNYIARETCKLSWKEKLQLINEVCLVKDKTNVNTNCVWTLKNNSFLKYWQTVSCPNEDSLQPPTKPQETISWKMNGRQTPRGRLSCPRIPSRWCPHLIGLSGWTGSNRKLLFLINVTDFNKMLLNRSNWGSWKTL